MPIKHLKRRRSRRLKITRQKAKRKPRTMSVKRRAAAPCPKYLMEIPAPRFVHGGKT